MEGPSEELLIKLLYVVIFGMMSVGLLVIFFGGE